MDILILEAGNGIGNNVYSGLFIEIPFKILHMKKHDDYLATSIWYKEEIKDPYQVIAECFTCASVDSYRRTIKDVLLIVSKDKMYRKENPADLLYSFKMIESVMNAAFLINLEK